jgi:hypothetical protein
VDRPDRHSIRRTWLRRTSMLAAATLVGALTWTMPAAHGAPEKRSTSVDEPGVTANLWEWNPGLPAGTYCDIIHDTNPGTGCTGPTVVVDSSGFTTVTVSSRDAVAFTRADRTNQI